MDEHVRTYDITVRGKKRRIFDPDHVLRAFQKRFRQMMLDRVPVAGCVHGFVPKRGCRTNAQAHLDHLMKVEGEGTKLMVRVDVADFFPSITVDRVHGMSSKVFNLNTKPAWLFTRLNTHAGHLAQGLPNSPIISNMIAWKIDRRLMAFAKKLGMHYTRYADDMYMSGLVKGSADWIMDRMKLVVQEEGFNVNEKKCAVLRNRIICTGIVVDHNEGKLKLPYKKRQMIKTMVDHWPEQDAERRMQIRGVLSWAMDAHPEFGLKMQARIAEYESGGGKKTWNKSISDKKGSIRRELHRR